MKERGGAIEKVLASLSNADLEVVRVATGATDADDRVFRVARDPFGLGAVIGVEIRADKQYGRDAQNVESRRDYTVGVLTAKEGFRELLPVVG